jgi:hypothetical protein
MGDVRWDECKKIVWEIASLARQETTLIDAEDFDAVWRGRWRRDQLTETLAALLAESSGSVEGVPKTTREVIELAFEKIRRWDQQNFQRLEQQKNSLRQELNRLHAGRVAVSRYRWVGDSTPSYVDQTSG